MILDHIVLSEHRQCPADARAEHDRQAFRVDVRRARVLPGLPGGDECDLLTAVQPAGLQPP